MTWPTHTTAERFKRIVGILATALAVAALILAVAIIMSACTVVDTVHPYPLPELVPTPPTWDPVTTCPTVEC